MAKRMEEPRFRALLFVVLAVIAGCLAMAGVYGVVAHAAEQRSKEICLRIALGANRAAVLKMMLGQGVMLATAGTALGLTGALGATRFLETMLFEVKPLDPAVYMAVVVLLGVVTIFASYLPARRAAVLNPLELLKTD
jgi:ABC-type antimicrobial peptide transport system permease subunit